MLLQIRLGLPACTLTVADYREVTNMPENETPNLFDYATKELSQDAIICWLIRWADDRYADVDRHIHSCGREFVLALLRDHGESSLPERIDTTICRQEKGIDVLAVLGANHVLLIEDKTGTKDHGNQLKRYYEHVTKGRTRLGEVREETVFPIYLKTGNQSRSKDKKIEGANEGYYRPYRVFNRGEFLGVLRQYEGNHPILKDYRDYLERWENSTNSFRNWKQEERPQWSWASWEGFYRYLECNLDVRDWSYVANPSGGFLGLWWNYIRVNGDGGPQIYLQLEASPKKKRHLLCFKVNNTPKASRREARLTWHKRIGEAGGDRVERPRVMRSGWTMTVGHWKGEWLAFDSNGEIDLPGTVANLKAAEQILRIAAEKIN